MAEWGIESDFERFLYRIGGALPVLRGIFYSDAQPVEVCYRKARPNENAGEAHAAGSKGRRGFRSIAVGQRWATEQWERCFFALSGKVPAAFAGRQVVLRFDAGAEAVAYSQGRPIQGLDANRDDLVVTVQARGNETFEYIIEAVAVTAFGKPVEARLKRAEICVFNPETYALYYDLQVVHSLAKGLGDKDAWARRLLYVANKSLDTWRDDFVNPEPRARARKAREALAPLYEQRASAAWPEVYLAGHAHIDVAWLWPLEETVRKCSRTFSTAVRYLAEYPEFRFSQSQAVLYEMTRRHFPSLFESIRELVAEGRWEPVGGMWLECDCNMTGGEALVRQFMYGRSFFRREFGKEAGESAVCWLPDTFGFPASLPQILRQCGLRYFATAKIAWNTYTEFPFSTFRWRGIDGSEVLGHILNSGDYNEHVFPDRLLELARHFKQSDRSPAFFLSFGYGDGGGGPTRGMLERARRVKDLFGVPKARLASLADFFGRIERDSENLPVHSGELYLEIHRGTLTTQSQTKRNNRTAELALRRVEILLSMLHMLGSRLDCRQELDDIWKTVLTLQFHDVLPGSSIGWVYRDAERMYAEAFDRLARIEKEAARRISQLLDTRGEGQPFLVFNYLSWDRIGVVEIPVPVDDVAYQAFSAAGEPLCSQQAADSAGRRVLLVELPSVPPLGCTLVRIRQSAGAPGRSDVKAQGGRTLMNEVLRVRLDRHGRLENVFDRRYGREVLAAGQRGNVLQLFADQPIRWEAWDVDEDFERVSSTLAADSIEVVENGPVRAGIRARYQFGASSIVQYTRLYSGLPWIAFDTLVDWRERQKLLKAAFPLAIETATATYEIQFGAIERPATRNTLSERARFEVAAHHWADLSQPDYGASLLNDCKYGHDAKAATLRLSLLRGAGMPDAEADIGEHQFRYALFPHKYDWRRARTVRAGYEFNVPLAAYPVKPHRGKLPPALSFMRLEAENVVVSTLKPAQAGDGVIVRAYEAHGEEARATFGFDTAIGSVSETNLLEEDAQPVPASRNVFDARFRPFEIKTFQVQLG